MGCCCQPCIKTFGKDRLDFDLDDGRTWKEAFGKSSLKCCNRLAFFLTRVFLTSFWFFVMVWDLIDYANDGSVQYWIIYLTHWGVVLELVWLFFGTFTTGQALWGSVPDGTGDETPWFVSVTWFLYSMTPLAAFIIVVLYWALVYDPDTTTLTVLNILKHGGNLVIALIDILISRQPLYLAHVYVPLLFSALYVLFTYIYFKAGGENESGDPFIYSSFDWRNEGTKDLAGVILLVAVPISYCLCFLLVMLRTCCRKGGTRELEEHV